MSAITSDTFSERFPRLADELSPGSVESLLGAFVVREAEAGEALVAEGTPTSDLFLVWDGSLDVFMRTPAGDTKVASVATGSYFGEVALFDPGPAGASVVTEQGCVTLWMNRTRFDEFRQASPEAAAALLREVAQSLVARLRAAAAYRPGLTDA